MIFSPGLLPKVLDGTKTVTRRRVKTGETECRYVAGRTYAVQETPSGEAASSAEGAGNNEGSYARLEVGT